MKIIADDYNHDWSKPEVKTIVLECHPYPECKPKEKKTYLVQTIWDGFNFDFDEWGGVGWVGRNMKGEIIAWAEMPESLVE